MPAYGEVVVINYRDDWLERNRYKLATYSGSHWVDFTNGEVIKITSKLRVVGWYPLGDGAEIKINVKE